MHVKYNSDTRKMIKMSVPQSPFPSPLRSDRSITRSNLHTRRSATRTRVMYVFPMIFFLIKAIRSDVLDARSIDIDCVCVCVC